MLTAEQIENVVRSEPMTLPINASAWLSVIDHMQTDVCLFRLHKSIDHKQRLIIVNPMKGSEIDYARTFLTMPMER